jgi:hypothetical protein
VVPSTTPAEHRVIEDHLTLRGVQRAGRAVKGINTLTPAILHR